MQTAPPNDGCILSGYVTTAELLGSTNRTACFKEVARPKSRCYAVAMGPYFIVFAGAGLGGMARHGVNMLAARLGIAFPAGTFAVNVAGSFLMGFLTAWFAHRMGVSQHIKLFLTTGLLGGFTTFSAFSLDAALMWERGAWGPLAAYALGSLLLSVAALFAGMATVRLLT